MKAVDIIWDIDEEDDDLTKIDLPTEIDIPDGIDEEEVSDYISDMTGFCHYGYKLIP